jgi:outer membrane lipoprotein-sorting protein
MKCAFLACLSVIWLACPWVAAEGPSAQQILERADAIRFPRGDHEVKATITFVRPSHDADLGKYDVLTKGFDKTLIKILAPATEHGNSLLMVGHDLWAFISNVSQPVRISFQQRLLGDVANGDLARANFVGDYTPTILKQNDRYYVLDLTAKTEEVTYGRILLEVEKKTYRPVKAQFFAVSGKLLKTGSYEGYRSLAGAVRPTRLVFDSPVVKDQKSVITYTAMTSGDFPDKYFTKDYLKKLKY